MEAPEVNYTCPVCGIAARGLSELIFSEGEVFWNGEIIWFKTRAAMKMFIFLFQRRGRLVAYEDLFDFLEGRATKPNDLTRVYIRAIREAIEKNLIPIVIRNVWGEGYIMNVRVKK